MNHKDIITRIQKLLSLSTSDNEHEAAAAAAKVQALLSKYNLEMSDIPGQNHQAQTAEKAKTKTRQRLEQWAFNLAQATAHAFDCDYFHSSSGYTIFVGVGADQEVCAWTYQYLYKTLLRMGSTYLREKQRRLRSNRSKSIARSSYLKGLVFTISQRLERQKADTPITESSLVPLKASAIEAAMPDNLKTRKFKGPKMRENDFMNGMLDGRFIPISSPLNGSGPLNLK
ncbi:DUF2786 domain-containing protein [Pseudodesulfovibrio sp.]|uniref:DUF2786 domain-containing protein n=1 Tax=unclassified Pseudodesulfovibrio TaxID=2661612 RepID=UPI003B00B6F1